MKPNPSPNQWIADFLMQRGCLKYADARRCASQILRHLQQAQLIEPFDKAHWDKPNTTDALLEEIKRLEAQRDQALQLLRRPYPNMHTLQTSQWFTDRDAFLASIDPNLSPTLNSHSQLSLIL